MNESPKFGLTWVSQGVGEQWPSLIAARLQVKGEPERAHKTIELCTIIRLLRTARIHILGFGVCVCSLCIMWLSSGLDNGTIVLRINTIISVNNDPHIFIFFFHFRDVMARLFTLSVRKCIMELNSMDCINLNSHIF